MQLARILRWSLAVLVIGSIAYIAGSIGNKKPIGVAVLDRLIESFREENAQTSFMSFVTTITPLSRLEVAKLEQLEVFDRASQETVFWKRFGLPQVVVRATLPVEYRYYVDIGKTWKVELVDRVMTVTVPSLEVGTPSPNISELRYEIRKGSIFRNEYTVANALKLELTSLLEKRAHDSTGLVKETARKQIGELAKKWLDSESKAAEVVVIFNDELPNLRAQ